ncbi:PKD domain-containing protein [Methanoplanus sp. FWC-SCC4]|uniref:PKD domain-containing protein n=1 Tax=Methanochimaera problematica TaxID=2609417 RepID=A0AA97FBK5_9EURY|nr:PKD domain-containing protein [Methanoplanus sp. FWC-SCC4]WOF15199.1 PKD domain-containing protein [Methanoplanus sp. FWC-SCC4]
MNPNSRTLLYTTILLGLFLLLSVMPVMAAEYTVSGEFREITNDTGVKWNPLVSDKYVIWTEKEQKGQSLYISELKTGEINPVESSRYTSFLTDISGSLVVWGEKRSFSSPSQIIIYNAEDKTKNYVSQYPANQGTPAISDESIVWLDGRYRGYTNIMVHDQKTGKTGLLRESRTSDKHSPTISGDFLYWTEKGTLYKKPLSGGTAQNLYSPVPNDFSVSSGRAVWEVKEGDSYTILLFDENTGTIKNISENLKNPGNPKISGPFIVWGDSESENQNIILHDLSTSISAFVYSGKGDLRSPDIWERNIVWTDKTGNDYRIVYFEISGSDTPKAFFEADVRDGLAPLNVKFSSGAAITPGVLTNFKWDFGDGETSLETDPAHIYKIPGSYNVSLTVSNIYGSTTKTLPGYITTGALPLADFSEDEITGEMPFTTRFYDHSSGIITGRLWNFGDGTGSVLKNPQHIYQSAGKYTVSLTVKNSYGGVTRTKTDLVDVGGAPKAAFVYSYDEKSTPEKPVVSFSDISSGEADSWLWYFGDNTFSEEQNPVHTFETPGVYDVSLKVENRYGSDIHTERNVAIARMSEYPVEKIIIVPGSAGAIKGDVIRFVAAATDTKGVTRIVYPNWSVGDESVASISKEGMFTAENQGKTKVFAEFSGIRASAEVVIGNERYSKKGVLPALFIPELPDKAMEDTKELAKIFYSGSE